MQDSVGANTGSEVEGVVLNANRFAGKRWIAVVVAAAVAVAVEWQWQWSRVAVQYASCRRRHTNHERHLLADHEVVRS